MTNREAAEALARSLPAQPYVAGGWQSHSDAEPFDVIDPVTERSITTVVEADAATVDTAVTAAHAAMDEGEWGRVDGPTRGQMLNSLAQLIEDHTEDFANLESLDVGKPGFEPRVIDLPQTVVQVQGDKLVAIHGAKGGIAAAKYPMPAWNAR